MVKKIIISFDGEKIIQQHDGVSKLEMMKVIRDVLKIIVYETKQLDSKDPIDESICEDLTEAHKLVNRDIELIEQFHRMVKE